MDYEQRREALCEIINANIRILETLKKQFDTPKVKRQWSYMQHENQPKTKLYELEEQDSAFQGLLGAVKSTLQDQGALLCNTLEQVHDARLHISLSCCFISKLPNELLGDILRRASDNSYFALQLTHVSRRWRAVAISISSLWTEIYLAPGSHQIARHPEFWQTISAYAQDAPARIFITDGDICDEIRDTKRYLWKNCGYGEFADDETIYKAIGHMSSYNLQTLKAVDSIEIRLEFEPDVRRLLHPNYKNLDCRCHTLQIVGDIYEDALSTVDLSELLFHFDAKVLKCANALWLDPGETVYQRALTEIHLSSIKKVPLRHLLMVLPEITVLCCTGSVIKWETAEILVHSKLRKLEVERTGDSDNCSWMEYLHCPALNDLNAPGWADGRGFVDFVARSSDLNKVNLVESDDRKFLRLVNHLSRVNHLILPPDALSLLHNWTSYQLSQAPVPALETLEIEDLDGEEHTLLPLIRERCLARRLLPNDACTRISMISIKVVGGRDILESSLRDSDIAGFIDLEWQGETMMIKVRNAMQ